MWHVWCRSLDDQAVTIRYKQRKSNRWRTSRIPGHEFMRRFLQHVLPKGLHKVRYFGLWHPARRKQAARARLLLLLTSPAAISQPKASKHAADPSTGNTQTAQSRACPHCKDGHLVYVGRLYPKQTRGP